MWLSAYCMLPSAKWDKVESWSVWADNPSAGVVRPICQEIYGPVERNNIRLIGNL